MNCFFKRNVSVIFSVAFFSSCGCALGSFAHASPSTTEWQWVALLNGRKRKALIDAACLGSGYAWRQRNAAAANAQMQSYEPPQRPDLPVFSANEIKTHSSLENGVWVTYRNAVYDVKMRFKKFKI